jgi:ATP-dependent Clp protease ATP-binding subunit ClpC
MFERYTERARLSIFFARYEASALGTLEITGEELLLGILREDKTVTIQLNPGALDAIRKELEQLAPPKQERTSTSVDMPVSDEVKRALAYAAEEAEAMHHKHIDAPHLALGLLRVEEGLAAKLLRNHGLVYERYRKMVAEPPLEERYQAEPDAPPEEFA